MPSGTESGDTGSSEVNYQQVLDGASQRSIDNAERNLSRRAEEKLGFGMGNLEVEQELQSVQKQIYELQNSGNVDHLQMMNLQAKAELLAERAVGGGFDQDDFDDRFGDDSNYETEYNATDDLLGKYGQEGVNETLNWAAGGGVSTEVAEAFNDALARNDENSFQAFESLRQLAQNPEYVNTEEHQFIDFSVANELAEQFGKPGQQLAAISAAITTGKCTRAEAAKIVLSNPEIAQAAFTAASRGIITLSL